MSSSRESTGLATETSFHTSASTGLDSQVDVMESAANKWNYSHRPPFSRSRPPSSSVLLAETPKQFTAAPSF
ncbi:hypothetical protein TNCV_1523031 [Trichonephila clavipes]|nr:hypothetical protein TNCV_1523031 [Trichonephila clavipes]